MSIKKLVRKLLAIITRRRKSTPIMAVRPSITPLDFQLQVMNAVMDIDALRRRLAQGNPVLGRPLEAIEAVFIRDARNALRDFPRGDADG
ncbi:MAG TPA: hypothetical protein VHX38_17400 [Pseudonocardiaceae bacterium]|nr:hypothetical protein [Pseudonocardiaceae bacterium]